MSNNRGRKLENVIVKLLGARPHKNSGAMAEKFDANTKHHVLEIKSTQAGSYKFDRSYWNQLCDDAIMHSKSPALVLAWDDKGEMEEGDVCVVISLSDFMSYKEIMLEFGIELD